ncbi:dihydroneopterin aldolase [Rhodothermus bifroesti]|uniref:7,8-dihydroneopterin aldolase n=1 Tax=Rhodothermus marinus TaxID=29549 RepID=A0A7V2B2Q8_RHOMR|nr:dihydroneopterin aldolase [Rhodothermus bifroesti]GBD02199.1 Dihydroneopterin aldolase [bacterium HR18]
MHPEATRALEPIPVASGQSRGIVRLVNAVFYAHHGITQEEHRIGGRYEVDVAMELNVEAAAQTDDLSQTVDYEGVYRLVHALVTGNKFYLIERLAYQIAQHILEAYPIVEAIAVTVRKPNPPVGGACDQAEVVYMSRR